MKYRTKLYISLVGVAFASITLGLVIFSTESEKLLMQILKSRSKSIVASAASLLDGDLFGKIKAGTSENAPEYIQARIKLQKLLKANRRNDLYVSDIYTVYPDPKDPQMLRFGIDADPDPNYPGQQYLDSDKELILRNLGDVYVDPGFVSDQYGVWISAYAPIYDSKGNYAASLGIDISASDIHLRMEELIKFGLWGLIASLVLAVGIAYFLSKRVTLSLDHLCRVVKEIGEGNLQAKTELKTDDEFNQLGMDINAMAKGLQERARLKMSFARYVSQHVLEKILTSDTPMKLEGERRKVTVLFSDIRQFTQLAEQMAPEEIVHLLNEYFERMIEVIFSHSGTLDKFIGDGIMAEFGAPLDDEEQEIHAIEAALHMHKELASLSQKWQKEGKPPLNMGIGIHTGEAILGNIGSEKRTEYTAIGDAVNVASRLEQATKMMQVPILISESTYVGCKDKFPFKDLGEMALPGRKEQIRVYTVNLGDLS